jgi:arginase
MPARLLQVPYMIGADRHPAAEGPKLLAETAVERLRARGAEVGVAPVDRDEPFADSVSAARVVNTRLAETVRRTVAAGELPIVLAGSCDACLGTLGGFDHTDCGVVWVDAHGDFNTPESTASGFFAGMSLAVAVGHCYRDYWGQIGDATPVAEDAVVAVGVRDLSPRAERERLERSAIRVVPVGGDVADALDDLATRRRDLYLHVDLDALDPSVAPGIVDTPVPRGLSLQGLEEVVRGATSRFRVRAAAVTTFNPALDEDDRTLHAALRVVELLVPPARAEAATGGAR